MITMASICGQWEWIVIFIRCKIYFKIKDEEKLPKLDYLLKHARTQKATFAMARVKIGGIYQKKKS